LVFQRKFFIKEVPVEFKKVLHIYITPGKQDLNQDLEQAVELVS